MRINIIISIISSIIICISVSIIIIVMVAKSMIISISTMCFNHVSGMENFNNKKSDAASMYDTGALFCPTIL